jgi:hypothetical protein
MVLPAILDKVPNFVVYYGALLSGWATTTCHEPGDLIFTFSLKRRGIEVNLYESPYAQGWTRWQTYGIIKTSESIHVCLCCFLSLHSFMAVVTSIAFGLTALITHTKELRGGEI